MPTLTITRTKSFLGAKRPFKVLADGKEIGRVANGSTIVVEVPEGICTISSKQDFFNTSDSLQLNLGANDKIGIIMKYRHGNMVFVGLILIIILASLVQHSLQKQINMNPLVGPFAIFLPLTLGLLLMAKMAKAFHITVTTGDWMDAK